MVIGAPTGDSPSRFMSPLPGMRGGATDDEDVAHPNSQAPTLPQFGVAAPAVSIASGVKELIDSPGGGLSDYSDIRSVHSSGVSSAPSDLREVRRQNKIEELQKRAAAKKSRAQALNETADSLELEAQITQLQRPQRCIWQISPQCWLWESPLTGWPVRGATLGPASRDTWSLTKPA